MYPLILRMAIILVPPLISISTENRTLYQSISFNENDSVFTAKSLSLSDREFAETPKAISVNFGYENEIPSIANSLIQPTKDLLCISTDIEKFTMPYLAEALLSRKNLSHAVNLEGLARDEEDWTTDGVGRFSKAKMLSYGQQISSSLSFQRLPKNGDVTSLHKNSKLLSLVLEVLERDLSDCDLLIAIDKHFSSSPVLQMLSMLPNEKQMLLVENIESLSSILWTSSRCRGYLFLLSGAQPILAFANEDLSSWDYEGRYVFAGFSSIDLEAMVTSEKGRKTEKIVGIVQSRSNGEWMVFMNQLFSSKKLKRINMWKEKTSFFPDKTSDLKGATLKISAFPWASNVFYYKKPNNPKVFRTGIDVEIIKIISALLNFTTLYERPPNGVLWGDLQEDGNWTGMLGVMNRGEADIGCPISITLYYLGIIEYTDPFKFRKICFIVRAKPPLPQWMAITYPFHKWTWLAVFAGFLISGPILYFLSLLNKTSGNERETFSSLLESIQYAFGMHLNEPLFHLPLRPNTKIYIAFLWLYCLIISISYSANLKAFLMTKKLPKQIETIQDLRESGDVLLGLDTFYKGMFQSSPNEHIQELAKHFKVIPDQKEILSLIDKGGYAYPGDNSYQESYLTIRRALQKGETELIQIKECYGAIIAAFALQKYSPLKRKFNTIIQHVLAGGLISRVFANTLRLRIDAQRQEEQSKQPTKEKETYGTTNPNVPLSMDHMQAVFYIIVALWVTSLIIFGMEIISDMM